MDDRRVRLQPRERLQNLPCARRVVLRAQCHRKQHHGLRLVGDHFQNFARLLFGEPGIDVQQFDGVVERSAEISRRISHAGVRRLSEISRAALWPGAPLTPPPGCVPEPHM